MNDHDRESVHQVLIRYATALDRKNWNLLRDVFAPDAVVDYRGIGGFRGLGEIVNVVSTVLSQCGATQHQLTNIRISIDGDSAKACSYLNAFHRGVGDYRGSFMVVLGEYSDKLMRTADGWRITERELTIIDVEGEIGIREFAAINTANH